MNSENDQFGKKQSGYDPQQDHLDLYQQGVEQGGDQGSAWFDEDTTGFSDPPPDSPVDASLSADGKEENVQQVGDDQGSKGKSGQDSGSGGGGKPKISKAVLSMAIGAPLALIAGAFIYSQINVGGNTNQPAVEITDAAQKAPEASQDGTTDMASIYRLGASSSGGNSGEAVVKQGGEPTVAAADIMTSAAGESQASGEIPPPDAQVNTAAALPPALPSATPAKTIPAAGVVSENPPAEPSVQQQVAPSPTAVAVNQAAVNQAQVNQVPASDIEQRVNDMQSKLDQSSLQAQELAAKLETLAARLESGLSDVNSRLAAASDARGRATSKPSVERSPSVESDDVLEQSAKRVNKPKKTAAYSGKESSKDSANKAYSDKKAKSSKWVLRSATPTDAWIASNASSTKLDRVVVGQTVSGIGRVSEIKQLENGQWAVIGDKGRIE